MHRIISKGSRSASNASVMCVRWIPSQTYLNLFEAILEAFGVVRHVYREKGLRSVMYNGRKSEVSRNTEKTTRSPEYRKSKSSSIQEEQVVTYTGRASRHLYRKSKSLRIEGRDNQSLTDFWPSRPLYTRETINPWLTSDRVVIYTGRSGRSHIREDNNFLVSDWFILSRQVYREKRSVKYRGKTTTS